MEYCGNYSVKLMFHFYSRAFITGQKAIQFPKGKVNGSDRIT